MASIVRRAPPAILATATLHWFGGGLHPVWPLAWLAPMPVLWFAAEAPIWAGAGAAFLAWFAGSFALFGYFHGTIHMPLPVALLISAESSLPVTLAAALFRVSLRRDALWLALFGPAGLWVAMEYGNSLVSPHGTHGSQAYTQLDFLPVLQVASVTGPWGITFLLVSTASALAIVASRFREVRALRAAGAGLALAALALLFGEVRLSQPQPGTPVKVGLLASDLKENSGVIEPGAPATRLFADYAREAAALVRQGAQVVVLPENMAVVIESDQAGSDKVFQDLADDSGAQIVAGMLRIEDGKKFNEARLYSPHAPVVAYDKQHLLPPFESPITPGTGLTLLTKPGSPWGLAICKDFDFTNPARHYGAAGVGLMLVPAWDFVDDAWAHGHIAIMRGVEDGFAMVRAARGGYLTVTDDRGRVLAEGKSWSNDFSSLIATVPSGHEDTLYVRFGDWFAWASIGVLLTCLARLVSSRPREGEMSHERKM